MVAKYPPERSHYVSPVKLVEKSKSPAKKPLPPHTFATEFLPKTAPKESTEIENTAPFERNSTGRKPQPPKRPNILKNGKNGNLNNDSGSDYISFNEDNEYGSSISTSMEARNGSLMNSSMNQISSVNSSTTVKPSTTLLNQSTVVNSSTIPKSSMNPLMKFTNPPLKSSDSSLKSVNSTIPSLKSSDSSMNSKNPSMNISSNWSNGTNSNVTTISNDSLASNEVQHEVNSLRNKKGKRMKKVFCIKNRTLFFTEIEVEEKQDEGFEYFNF